MSWILLVIIVIMIFWRNKNKLYSKIMKFESKLKNIYGEGEYCWFLTVRKDNSEHLKIKWADLWREDRVLINNVLRIYSKKRVSKPIKQYSNGAYMGETVDDITTKIWQRKNIWNLLILKNLRALIIFFFNGMNNLHTFFYHNIYKFAGKFGMNDWWGNKKNNHL